MNANLDSQQVDIACPHCSRKAKQSLGRLKRNPHLTCIGCGKGYDVDATSLKKTLQTVERQLSDFQRKLGKMFK